MRTSPSSSPAPSLPLALRFVRAIATLAAGALVALVVAFWGWRWFGPTPPLPPVAREPAAWAPAIVASPLFGSSKNPTNAPVTLAAPTTLHGDVRLLGVFAERDGKGYALFKLAGKGAVLVRDGAPLTDGVKVVAVRPDGVRLDDHGDLRDIALRAAPVSTTVGPAKTATSAPAQAARSACVLPAGYRGPVYRLNAELLSGLSAQPATWQSLVVPADGVLVVREGSALSPALGLSPGDRIAQANGIALVRIDDVIAAIVQPLLASQPVRVTGMHDGKPTEWVLVNAGACPV